VWYGEECPLLTGKGSGEGAVPSPQKKIDIGSQIGELWCKLGSFCTVHLGTPFPLSKKLGTPFPGVPDGNDLWSAASRQ